MLIALLRYEAQKTGQNLHLRRQAPEDNRSSGKQDPLLGRDIAGRYRIHRLIAKGGMGSVYEAEQIPLGRKVAIKILHEPPNSGDSSSFERRFFLEASTLARLNHVHTVTLHDYGQTDDDIFYLVMEYVDGVSLSRVLKAEKRLTPDRCVRLMLQVARALKNAHRHGIVHRDLKPGNLLIKEDEGEEVVKVVDFGLVKLTEGDQQITVTGMILGSPHCMAPEQVEGGEVDERTDIYALGVLLYRCLSGIYPFHGNTTAATMIAHVREPVPKMGEHVPSLFLPEGLEEIVGKCLAKAPEDRFQSMGELIHELAACGEVSPEDFTGVSTLVEVQPASRLPFIAGGVVALALVVGTLTWLFGSGSDVTQPAAVVAPTPVSVALRSNPSGAEVWSDDRLLGTTPLNVQLQSEGEVDARAFTFKMEGYVHANILRDLAGQDAMEVEIDLEALPSDAPLLPPDPDLEQAPPEPATKQAEPIRSRPLPEKPPVEPALSPETEDAAEDPPGEDKDALPAGYKSNPFD